MILYVKGVKGTRPTNDPKIKADFSSVEQHKNINIGDTLNTRHEQKELRRKEILSSSLHLFSTKGYSETKITDIAKSVGMSVGLLFHYFESKEVLYSELIIMGITFVKEKTANLVKEPVGYFQCAAEMIIDLFKRDVQAAQMYKLIRSALKTNAIPDDTIVYIKNVFSEFFQLNMQKIIAGQEQGTIKTGDPKALTMMIFSCIDGIAEAYLMNPDMPLPEPEWIVDIIKRH